MSDTYLSAELVKQDLDTSVIGKEIIYLPITTSTNEIARQVARDGAVEGTLVIAAKQTAGRGRLQRSWLSPEGVLALSVILRPQTSRLSDLIMIASLAVVHTIKKTTGLESLIKWPNDVLIGGKKVCGILIENGWRGITLDHAIIGIGVNVNFNPADYCEIADNATSLSSELGRHVSILAVAHMLINELDSLYLGKDVFNDWREKLVTLGHPVNATDGNAITSGIAESVNRDGSLNIRQHNGTLVNITAGDVLINLKSDT